MAHDLPDALAFNRRLKLAIISVAIGVILTLAAVRSLDLWRRRDAVLQTGERRAANLALMLADYVRGTFAAADAALRQLTVYSQQVGGPAAPAEKWTPLLGSSRTGLNGIGSLSVVDETGIIRHSTVSNIVGSSRTSNSLYKRLAAGAKDALMVDTPFRSANGTAMLIPLGRRLVRGDGAFDGAVVASFTPWDLRRYFQKVDVGVKGHVWVFHPEGFVMFHEPSVADPIGEKAEGNPLFEWSRSLGAAEMARSERGTGVGQDGAIVAYQRIGEPRLGVVVSLDERELLADWRREAWVSAGVLTLFALTIAAGTRVLCRQIDARAVAEQALGRAQRLESLGQLTGGVAHDFNNLLTVIMMNVSVMKMSGGAPGANTEIDEIEKAAQRAAELTRQLLTFARRQPLQPQKIDLSELVRGLQPMLTRVVSADVEMTFKFSEGPCPTEIDPTQAENALLNLCVNARDAMPQGGRISVEVGMVTLDAEYARSNEEVVPGRYVVVAVSDTGVGIPPENLARVFEPFFTTKEKGRGTGLGLSMIYGFVRQSGGHVKVDSEVGQGTAVRLYFPALAETGGVVPRAPVAPATTRGRGERILLVEDESGVRELARAILERLGYSVIAAADGPTALELAKREATIDLLFTDVVLPNGMNGKQVADELVRLRPGLRVLFASGYSEDILQHRGQLAPGVRLLNKPYDNEQLAKMVRAVLDAPSGGGSGAV